MSDISVAVSRIAKVTPRAEKTTPRAAEASPDRWSIDTELYSTYSSYKYFPPYSEHTLAYRAQLLEMIKKKSVMRDGDLHTIAAICSDLHDRAYTVRMMSDAVLKDDIRELLKGKIEDAIRTSSAEILNLDTFDMPTREIFAFERSLQGASPEVKAKKMNEYLKNVYYTPGKHEYLDIPTAPVWEDWVAFKKAVNYLTSGSVPTVAAKAYLYILACKEKKARTIPSTSFATFLRKTVDCDEAVPFYYSILLKAGVEKGRIAMVVGEPRSVEAPQPGKPKPMDHMIVLFRHGKLYFGADQSAINLDTDTARIIQRSMNTRPASFKVSDPKAYMNYTFDMDTYFLRKDMNIQDFNTLVK